jgi:hypothetical protein
MRDGIRYPASSIRSHYEGDPCQETDNSVKS